MKNAWNYVRLAYWWTRMKMLKVSHWHAYPNAEGTPLTIEEKADIFKIFVRELKKHK